MTPDAHPRPTVAVWRSDWLPRSETFIANQVGAYGRWRPLRMARRALDHGGPPPDVAPYGHSLGSRLAWRATGAGLHRRAYRRALAASGAEVVHAHFGWDAVEVLPVVRASGLPLVATFHGADVTARRVRARGREVDPGPGLAAVFEEARALVAVSRFIAGRLCDRGAPPEKVAVLPIGIPTSGVGEPPPGTGPRAGVLFAGRFVAKKGVADLVTAYAGLPARLRAAHPLVLVGDGPDRATVEALARRLGVAVDVRGWLPPAEVAGLMGSSAAFCGPSRTAPDGDAEGLGMVFLEAALHGLPVVAYRHGGVPEAVVDGVTGLLADEGDVDGLAERLAVVLDAPDRGAALGAAGRARVLAEWDVATRTPDLEALYDHIVS